MKLNLQWVGNTKDGSLKATSPFGRIELQKNHEGIWASIMGIGHPMISASVNYLYVVERAESYITNLLHATLNEYGYEFDEVYSSSYGAMRYTRGGYYIYIYSCLESDYDHWRMTVYGSGSRRDSFSLGSKDCIKQILAMRESQNNPPKIAIGSRVRKKSGSEWEGVVVGSYSTKLTPVGWCVESSTHQGSVQIYPEKALELVDTDK